MKRRTPPNVTPTSAAPKPLAFSPRAFDLDSFMVNVLTEQIEGLYDPKTREFYIADWSPLADQRMVMAHELTHALEGPAFPDRGVGKSSQAQRGCRAGARRRARGQRHGRMVDYLMLGTGRSLKDVPDFDPGMLIAIWAALPRFKKAPPFLKDALIFPYLGGLTFSAAVMKNTGWAALPACSRSPRFPHNRFSTRRSIVPASLLQVSLSAAREIARRQLVKARRKHHG